MKRFRGDLWQCDRGTLVTACRLIMSARGSEVAQVYTLTTGLWVDVRLTNGHTVLLSEDEVRTFVWRHTAGNN